MHRGVSQISLMSAGHVTQSGRKFFWSCAGHAAAGLDRWASRSARTAAQRRSAEASGSQRACAGEAARNRAIGAVRREGETGVLHRAGRPLDLAGSFRCM